MTFLLPLSLLLALTPSPTPVPTCGYFCRYRLCSYPYFAALPRSAFITLSTPHEATYPSICRGRAPIGRILRTDEPYILNDSAQLTPLSNWTTEGLKARFPPDFFFAAPVSYQPFSSITFQKPRRVFRPFLHNRCLILPIQSVEKLSPSNITSRVVDLRPDPKNCVAFRTKAPVIYIQLKWDTADDLDLEVHLPNKIKLRPGERKNRFLRRSRTACGGAGATRSEEAWFAAEAAEEGTYFVEVWQVSKCQANTDTVWTLTIAKDYRNLGEWHGIAPREWEDRLYTVHFKYP